MFAPVDNTIGAYSSIFNHFQTSNQESVLKNKWLSKLSKKEKKKNPYRPTLIFCLCYANQTIFFKGLMKSLKYLIV